MKLISCILLLLFIYSYSFAVITDDDICPPDIYYTEKGRFDLRKGENLKYNIDTGEIIMIDSANHSWLYIDPEQKRFFDYSTTLLLAIGAVWGFTDAVNKDAGSGFLTGMACTGFLIMRFS
jgi:hypothetical protein